jgi:Ca2+-binding RTX toxin-like protein
MVVLVARQPVDTRDLSELGLFSNFKNLKRKGEGSSFNVKSGDIAMHVEGKNMLFVLKKPVSGVVHSIEVKDGGVLQYTVSNLDIKLTKMQKFFKGDFEAHLFSGSDSVSGSDRGDTIYTYKNGDHVKGLGGADQIVTAGGNDDLFGGGGNDALFGGRGNDALDGGGGRNSATGGDGADSFQFSAQLRAGNVTTITDFKIGRDLIELNNSAFPGIGGRGKLPASKFVLASQYDGQDDVVVYNKTTGALLYDLTGGDLADAIRFASVTAGLNLSNKDFMII